jgi:hypothetical protein
MELLGTRGKGIEQKVLGFTQGLEPVLLNGFYFIYLNGEGGEVEWGFKETV